jgi:WD40 repeat protein
LPALWPAGLALALALTALGPVAGEEDLIKRLYRSRSCPPAPSESAKHRIRLEADPESGRALVTQLQFTHDGKRLVGYGYDHLIHVWDVAKGKQTFALGDKATHVYHFALTEDDKLVAAAWLPKSKETKIHVYDLETRKLQGSFTPPNSLSRPFCIRPKTKHLIVGGGGKAQPEILEIETGNHVAVVGARRDATRLAVSADGKWLAIGPGPKGGKPALWRLDEEKVAHELEGFKKTPDAFVFSPDSKGLAVTYSGGVFFYERGEKSWEATYLLDLTKSVGRAKEVAYSADGRFLAATGAGPGAVIWDLKKKELHASFLTAKDSGDTAVCFSPDGKTLAVGGTKGDVLLFDVPPLKEDKEKKDKK